MTDEELQEIKKITLKKQELKTLKKKILKLEEDPKIKEYIETVNSLNAEKNNNDTIVITRKQSNNLLFKYGRFFGKINSFDSFDMYAFLYRDLETTEFFYHPGYAYRKVYGIYIRNFSEEKEFEKKNVEFNELRECFFEQLLNKSQEEAVYEMLKNNKHLVKVRKNELLL